ncbi:MAG: ABC transporter permease, partial [Ruminiclostridium sp.]|nr:ABC transporter permease [Ruminiclostridium sp.]
MLNKIKSSKGIVTAVWVLGLMVIWEICAFIVGATQRTPINVLPHLYQIFGSFFDPKPITGSGDTIATLVFSSAAETLSRALIGFVIGMLLGYALALFMNLSHIVEKIAFPYLMIIQMIPILGMAPIVLSITG